MINKRDTLRLLMPYPNKASVLANIRHMYVCIAEDHGHYQFVKCQTLKQTMLIHSPVTHFVDETPTLMRNPFVNPTRIDCDKVFTSDGVIYRDALKTTNRPNISEEVMTLITQNFDTPDFIPIDEPDLIRLNAPNVVKR